MNCEPILSTFNATCQHISDSLAYVESPLTTAYDDGTIGAYVQELSPGKYRLSDNGETLFSASVHQIAPSLSKILSINERIGLAQVSESGEIFMVCKEAELGYSYSLFVDHISRLGVELDKLKPKPKTAFQRMIAKVLVDQFGQTIKQNQSVIGASGHEITFQFALSLESKVKYINTISAKPAGPNWPSVYGNIGKMMDARGAMPNLNRVIVLQRSASPDEDEKAVVALAEASKVVIYENPAMLCDVLAA